jgi:D-alanyl-D-alanine carboxypeptidase
MTSKTDKYLSYSIAGIFTLFVFVAFPQSTSHIEAQQQIVQPVAKNYFASTTIVAQAAYVFDAKNHQVLFQKNADASLPLASLTKIMTAITAVSSAPTSTVITISPESLNQEGDSGLYGDEQWNLKDLLAYVLVVSSNDGAAAVAGGLGDHDISASFSSSEQNFVKTMNENARRLGLLETRFYNPTGLDISTTQAGAYGSAKDVATLLTYAINTFPDIIANTAKTQISVTSLSNFTHTAPNTDILTGQISGLIAGKTGYTELAGGNLAVAVNALDHHPVIVVVLGSTYDDRFKDVESLITAAKKTILDRK